VNAWGATEHKFKIGSLCSVPIDGEPQYEIRSTLEQHDRIAKEKGGCANFARTSNRSSTSQALRQKCHAFSANSFIGWVSARCRIDATVMSAASCYSVRGHTADNRDAQLRA
jgi:hypothetical protein